MKDRWAWIDGGPWIALRDTRVSFTVAKPSAAAAAMKGAWRTPGKRDSRCGFGCVYYPETVHYPGAVEVSVEGVPYALTYRQAETLCAKLKLRAAQLDKLMALSASALCLLEEYKAARGGDGYSGPAVDGKCPYCGGGIHEPVEATCSH